MLAGVAAADITAAAAAGVIAAAGAADIIAAAGAVGITAAGVVLTSTADITGRITGVTITTNRDLAHCWQVNNVDDVPVRVRHPFLFAFLHSSFDFYADSIFALRLPDH